MRVVFMGTPDFSVGVLNAIVNDGHEVVGVVTQPDKPKGRGKEISVTPVKKRAEELGLPVFQPEKVKTEESVSKLREMDPDVIVVVAFGQMLSREILDIAKYGCINVHASILPEYRGAAPIQFAVIDGCKKSGVTIMQMDEGMDTGDILSVREVELSPKETGGSLFDKLSITGAELLAETLKLLEEGKITPVKQDNAKATHVKKLDKGLGCINFHKSAEEIERLIRGLNPWPSAYTHLEDKTLKIWDADVETETYTGEPGCVVMSDKHGFIIQCGQGALRVNELQMEGKKRMTAEAFMRGYNLKQGIKFS